jgi:hypothetical protein
MINSEILFLKIYLLPEKIHSMKPNSLNTIFQYSFVCFVKPFLTGGLISLFGISGTFDSCFEETKINSNSKNL